MKSRSGDTNKTRELMPLSRNNSNKQTLDEFENVSLTETIDEATRLISQPSPNPNVQEQQTLVRWLYRNQFASRLLAIPALYSQHQRLLFLSGPSIPLESRKARAWISYVTAFYHGVRGYTDIIWPAAFWSMLLADIIQFAQYPASRYGNSIDKILGGTSSSQLMLTSLLGMDLPADGAGFWMPAVTVTFLAPMVVGLLNVALHYNRHHNYANRLDQNWLQEARQKTRQETRWESFCHLLPLGALSQAKFNLLWNKQLYDSNEAGTLLDFTIDRAKSDSGLISLRAMSVLAYISDSFHRADAIKTETPIVILGQTKIPALDALKEIAKGSNYIKRFWSEYLLWTLGHFDHPLERQFLQARIIATAMMLYPAGRLIELWVEKILRNQTFKMAEQACVAENRLWSYLPEYADYDCLACHGPQVSLQAQYSAQDCLDALLRFSDSPTAILKQLPSLLRQKGITDIDLSHQDWPRWLTSELDSFFTTFEQANLTQFNSLNLSRSVVSLIPPSPTHIKRLARFVQKHKIQTLVLKRLNLGADNMQQLMPSVVVANTTLLDLSENGLGDKGIITIAIQLPNSMIKTIKFRSNQIGDEGLNAFSAHSLNSSLTAVDFSDNRFSEEGVINFAKASNASQLVYVEFADNMLSVNAVKALSTSRPFHTFGLANTGMTDQKLKYLSAYFKQQNTTRVINLSDNRITNFGIRGLFYDLRNKILQSINIANNDVSDSGLQAIGNVISEIILFELDISDCRFSNKAYAQFLDALRNSTLRSLKSQNNMLTDTIIPPLASCLATGTYPVQRFDFYDNRITSQGLNKLAPAMIKSNVTHLILGHNRLDIYAGPALTDMVSNGMLKVLDVSKNFFNGSVVLQVVPALAKGNLEQLILDHIPIGEEVGLALVNSLIKPLPNQEHYLAQGSRDERRALKQAQPGNRLTGLSLDNTQIGNNTARLLCRFQPHTNISLANLHLNDNSIGRQIVDIRTCEISSAARLKLPFPIEQLTQGVGQIKSYFTRPQQRTNMTRLNAPSASNSFSSMMLLYGLPLLIIVYLLYRIARPLVQATNRYRLFPSFTQQNNPSTPDNKTLITTKALR